MSLGRRVILLVGGLLHAMLILLSLFGVFTVVVAFRARPWEIEREGAPQGLLLAALLLIAVPFGWLCMKLARHPHPWRAELIALAVIVPSIAIITTLGALAQYAVRSDPAASFSWTVISWITVVLSGAISFYLIGRRQNSRPRSETARGAVEPE